MPKNIKIVVSILVLLVTVVVFYFEQRAGAGTLKWVVLGLGAFMAFSLWIFPEPKADGDKEPSDKAS